MTDHFQAYNPVVQAPYQRDQYPRLRDRESDVLRHYLSETGTDNIETLRTAVPVGEGEVEGMPEGRFEEQKKALSQFKIDAVVDRPGRQEILELKSRATHTAIGQVTAYDYYLGLRNNEPTTSRRVIASFRVHPDLPEIASVAGVRLHSVPRADRSTATQRFLADMDRLDEFDA